MTCELFLRYLDLYLDGEMAEDERAEMDAHLKVCESCRQSIAFESRFKQILRSNLLSCRAPASLREQISQRIRERKEYNSTPKFINAIWAMAAIMIIVVAGYVFVSLLQDSSTKDIPEDAVALHMASDTLEVYGDYQKVASFLSKNAPFLVKVPFEDKGDLRLVGAKVTRFGGLPAIVYVYDKGGKRLSVVQYPAKRIENPVDFMVGRYSGLTVATYRDGELYQTVVGDFEDKEARTFIPIKW